jgi:hypothetical protein
MEGIDARAIYDYRRSLEELGCGLYSRSKFVHVDVRSRATIWVDLSMHGDVRQYAKDPTAWLNAHPEAGRSQ